MRFQFGLWFVYFSSLVGKLWKRDFSRLASTNRMLASCSSFLFPFLLPSFICSSKSYFLISLSCTTLSIIIERKFAIKARKYHIFTRKYYSYGTSITYVEKRFIYVKEVFLKQTACHKHTRSPAENCCKFFQLFRLMVDTEKSFEHFVGVFLTLGL